MTQNGYSTIKDNYNSLRSTFAGLVVLALLSILLSCNSKKVIPESKLVDILSEMYITDAFIERNSAEIYRNHPRDSVSIYGPIVAKYGYNLDDFRRSMLVYADKNNGLQNIYKKVQEQLTAKKKEYEPQARIEELSKNLWIAPDSMTVDINSVFRKINFDVVLKETGVYQVSADARFFKDDSTKNPRMAVWFAKDNTDSIHKKQEVTLNKDTSFQSYGFEVLFADPEFNLLKGYWLDYDTVNVQRVKLSAKALNARKERLGNKYYDSVIGKQHFMLRNITIKYDFEASELAKDTIKTIQEQKQVKK